MSFYARFQEMKATGDFSGLAEALPYTKFMGMSVKIVEGRLITQMTYDDKLIGNTVLPALHGGTLAALLEAAALFQIAYDLDTKVMPKVITLTVDYMRSGRPKLTRARAAATRVGRRVANVRAEAWQEDPSKPITAANINFLLS